MATGDADGGDLRVSCFATILPCLGELKHGGWEKIFRPSVSCCSALSRLPGTIIFNKAVDGDHPPWAGSAEWHCKSMIQANLWGGWWGWLTAQEGQSFGCDL